MRPDAERFDIFTDMPASIDIDLRWVDHGSHGWQEAVSLRQRVLRAPLGLRLAPHDLAAEADQLHLIARCGDQVVGTSILVIGNDRTGQVRQVAVAPERTGTGIGRRLMAAVEDRARSMGMERIGCHARCTARAFYESLGWTAHGPVFTQIGIDHVVMEKQLAASKSVSSP